MSTAAQPLPPEDEALPRSPELMNAEDTGLLVVDMQERLLAAIRQRDQLVWNPEQRTHRSALVLYHREAVEKRDPPRPLAVIPISPACLPDDEICIPVEWASIYINKAFLLN